MLNERAAVAGTLAAADEALLRLAGRQRSLESSLAVVRQHMDQLQSTRANASQALAALDVTVGLAFPLVRPDAAGKVSAWAGTYGKRGALRAFVFQQIKAAAPRAVSTSPAARRVLASSSAFAAGLSSAGPAAVLSEPCRKATRARRSSPASRR